MWPVVDATDETGVDGEEHKLWGKVRVLMLTEVSQKLHHRMNKSYGDDVYVGESSRSISQLSRLQDFLIHFSSLNVSDTSLHEPERSVVLLTGLSIISPTTTTGEGQAVQLSFWVGRSSSEP